MSSKSYVSTGVIAYLKLNVFASVFNVSIIDSTTVIFVQQGVIEQLQSMIECA